MKKAAFDHIGTLGAEYADNTIKRENTRYNAAVYFGAKVKEGLFTWEAPKKDSDQPDDAKQAVLAYCKAAGLAVAGPSFNVMVSTFRSFGNPAAQGKRADIEKAIKAAGREKCGSKDLYAAAYAINSKINSLTKANEKVPDVGKLIATVFEKAKEAKAKDGGKTKIARGNGTYVHRQVGGSAGQGEGSAARCEVAPRTAPRA